MDAYEAHLLLLARWRGGEDLEKAVIASFKGGECRRILEMLEKKELSIYDAVDKISGIVSRIHIEVH